MKALSYIGSEKITFPPKPDRQTDVHMDIRTDIMKKNITVMFDFLTMHVLLRKNTILFPLLSLSLSLSITCLLFWWIEIIYLMNYPELIKYLYVIVVSIICASEFNDFWDKLYLCSACWCSFLLDFIVFFLSFILDNCFSSPPPRSKKNNWGPNPVGPIYFQGSTKQKSEWKFTLELFCH